MNWEKPTFEEINMSAEIGAYQGDDDGWNTLTSAPSSAGSETINDAA